MVRQCMLQERQVWGKGKVLSEAPRALDPSSFLFPLGVGGAVHDVPPYLFRGGCHCGRPCAG